MKILTDKIFLLTLFVIGTVIYYGADLLLWAVLTSWLVFNCVSLIVHIGWSHNYLIPKNKVFKFFLDLIGYLTVLPSLKGVSPKIFWKYVHPIHHRYWKDPEKDYLQWELTHNHWLRYLFTVDARHRQSSEDWAKHFNNDKTFVDRHFNLIIITLHLLFLFLLGFKLYFYFVLFQIWAFERQMALVGEIIPHINKKSREEEHDQLLLFPFYGESAYHVSHHRYPFVLNLGTGYLKYFNIQYYFIKIFYNINPKVKII